jgi:two-component system, LytTR family, sensor kinase
MKKSYFFYSFLLLLVSISHTFLAQDCTCSSLDKLHKSRDFDSTITHTYSNEWKISAQFIKKKSKRCQAYGFNLLASAQLNDEQHKEALESLNKEKSLLDQLKCSQQVYVDWYVLMGHYFLKVGKYRDAENHFLRAEVLASGLKNKVLSTRISVYLAQVYSKLNRPDVVEKRTIASYTNVVRFADNESKVDMLNQLSQRFVYLYKKTDKVENLDSAQSCALYAKRLSQKMNYIPGWVKAFDVLEDQFYLKDNFKQASICLDSALIISNQPLFWRIRAPLFEDLTDLYLEQKRYERAYQFADSNLVYANKTKDILKVKSALDLLYNCAKLSGNFDRAIETFDLIDQIKDSVANVENSQALSLLEEKYHKARKTNSEEERLQDRKLLEKQREISDLKRKLITVGVIVFALLLAYVFVVWRQKNVKQAKHDLHLKMRLDRARINPDFINQALVELQKTTNDSTQLEQKINGFSKLLKRTQESTNNDFMTLDKEIEFLETYLELQQSRVKRKFTYEFHIDNALVLKDVCIPTMILQPFLESTITDGFKNLGHNGEINLYFSQTKPGELGIKIQDNGRGLKAIDSSRAGEIINDRFYLLNHMQRGFASYLARERQSGGVSVEIFIPLISKELADDYAQREL